MNFDLNKKQVLIGGGILAGVIAVKSAILIKKELKKKQIQKEKELSEIIDNLDNISNKIAELTKTQKQLDTLAEQKLLLKDAYIFGPY